MKAFQFLRVAVPRQAVIRDPDLAEAYNALGRLHMEKKVWADAATFFDTAISKVCLSAPCVSFNSMWLAADFSVRLTCVCAKVRAYLRF